jgi:hypothetical protein
MSRDHALMERHVEALYTHDAAGRLVTVREHNGAPAPRFFLGRTPNAVVCRCRYDVDDALCTALEAAAAADPVDFAAEVASDGAAVDPARYVDLLARAAPVTKVWGGPAFRFPTAIPDASAHDSASAERGAVVLVTDVNADVLHPLLPTWARAVRALGAEPLYSTSWQNAASRAVARKLGLVLYGTDLSIS